MKTRKKLWIFLLSLFCLVLGGCGAQEGETEAEAPGVSWESLSFPQELEILYATQFSAASSPEGYTKISIEDGLSYLVVPEGAAVPSGVPAEITVIQQPLDHIYLAATSAMDLFRALEAIDKLTLSGVEADGWYIPEAKEAMEQGRMEYAGKYRAPDYELLLSRSCDLAIESTMIYHTPEVKEQLEDFGVPVLVERSSYENHPLGRMEWIKLYGLLLGREDAAAEYFDTQVEKLRDILQTENTGKTVAFFYITSNGAANVRKSGDYLAKAIELAGGTYLFQDLPGEDNAQATTNLQMEAFYAKAKQADVLIYSSTIDGELQTMEELLEKSPVLSDCKAVKEGAALLGGALSISGFLLQTFFANPIASPFVLGISSGAKLTVALTMIFLLQRGILSNSFVLIGSAFVGAMLSMGFVLLVSQKIRRMSVLVICGIMVGYICSAVTDFAVTFAEDANIVNLHNWSVGSFSGITWSNLGVIAGTVGLAVLWAFCLSKPMGAYQLGESYAQSVGVSIRRFRVELILLSSVLSACVTAFAGPISFVGIAVPHLVRTLMGTAKPILVIPGCFLGGAVFCLFCDLVARTVFAPVEMSISSVTALFGAPIVIYMMVRRQSKAM